MAIMLHKKAMRYSRKFRLIQNGLKPEGLLLKYGFVRIVEIVHFTDHSYDVFSDF